LSLLPVLIVLLLVAAACNTGNGSSGEATPEAPLDPQALLFEAVENIRALQTFRMEIVTSGTECPFEINLGIATGTATFVRGVAQFVAPDTMQANARLNFVGFPTDIVAFARTERQWLSVSGGGWLELTFAPGFNPASLVEEDGAFEAALSSLQ